MTAAANCNSTMSPSLLHNMTLFLFVSLLSWSAESFSTSPTSSSSSATAAPRCHGRREVSSSSLFMSSVTSEASLPMPMEGEDDEDMEWVEEEFELLTERDFYNTEWKMGTLMENKPREAKSIDTTWVRLVTTETGENKAVWGDNSQGKWTVDVPSQFFSISKESFGGWFGKQIWAGTIDDFYFLEGTVRGWSPISPASVDGQWQAVRLGVLDGDRVTLEERGEAPWFAIEDEVEDGEKLELDGDVGTDDESEGGELKL